MSAPSSRPDSREHAVREALLARLRERAEGPLLTSLHADGTETVFCGNGPDGEYLGWQERSYADSKGYSYKGRPDEDIDALLAEIERLEGALRITKTAWTNHDGSITVQLEGQQAVEIGDEMEIGAFVDSVLADGGQENPAS